jgi:hypothetical protein
MDEAAKRHQPTQPETHQFSLAVSVNSGSVCGGTPRVSQVSRIELHPDARQMTTHVIRIADDQRELLTVMAVSHP